MVQIEADITEADITEADIMEAADRIGAYAAATDRWRHYAVETGQEYEMTRSDMEALVRLMRDPDPSVANDAYSHWCAAGHGQPVEE